MVAAPQKAQFTFIGRSGRTYNLDCYASDVAGGAVNLDGGNAAGTSSPTFWITPEPCTLVDFAIHTGMTDTTQLVLVSNGAQIPAARLRFAVYLDSLNNRPAIRIPFNQGSQFGAIQGA